MFISLDLETTGFSPEKDKIIEFGAVKFDLSGEKERLQFLVNPGVPLPSVITHITGITDKDLENAEPFENKTREISDFIQNLPIIGHNIQFDTGFLRANNITLNNPEYDTCELSTILLPGFGSYSLEVLTKILNLQHEEKHRALDDSIAAMELFIKLINHLQSFHPDFLKKIQNLSVKSNWPLKDLISSLSPLKEKLLINLEQIISDNDQKNPKPIYQKILQKSNNQLFEIIPPFKNLITYLAENIDKDSYVSLPQNLFTKACNYLPDNIAKLDNPENYLSPNRLKQFENKDFFENHEITALIKFLIWKEQTKTGLLNEVLLSKDEKKIRMEINANPFFAEIEKEKFIESARKKDKQNCAVCSHNYLINNPPENKKIIIIDFDRFHEDLLFENSVFLNFDLAINPLQSLENKEPENQIIKSLISKTTILFGLLGVFFEKYNDKSPYGARAFITNLDLNSDTYQEIKQTYQNILNLSGQLTEINHIYIGYLKKWKEILSMLDQIINSPDPEKNLIWMEKNFNDELIIRKMPFSIAKEVNAFLNKPKNYQLIDETFDLADQGETNKTLYALPADLSLEKEKQNKENREINVIEDSPFQENDLIKSTIKIIEKNLQANKENIGILLNSKKLLEKFTLAISKNINTKNINVLSQLTGSVGKLNEQFSDLNSPSIVLMTPHSWPNFQHPEKITQLYIPKLPFAPLSHPKIVSASNNFENPFIELQVPLAEKNLKKSINRLPDENFKKIYIFDSRLVTKEYGKGFLETLKSIGTLKIISLTNLT